MNRHLQNTILQATGASAIATQEPLQTLWSGYGEIVRLHLRGSALNTVIIKQINRRGEGDHPTGWNSDRSHRRKMKSYAVEMHWYQEWSSRCDAGCRVARCYSASASRDEDLIVLEDLDASGFALRKSRLTRDEVKRCLSWLAHFHATFMDEAPTGLWPVGSYWHLETRPDELAALQHPQLKAAAGQFDQRLKSCHYQTLVHGDAKVENFCFSAAGDAVAAVDFQYVGGGCGMKDVAYLFDSCLSDAQCTAWESELLEHYFTTLKAALLHHHKSVEWSVLHDEWRTLYPIAWADFYRFLLGWTSSHYHFGSYAQGMIEKALRM